MRKKINWAITLHMEIRGSYKVKNKMYRCLTIFEAIFKLGGVQNPSSKRGSLWWPLRVAAQGHFDVKVLMGPNKINATYKHLHINILAL